MGLISRGGVLAEELHGPSLGVKPKGKELGHEDSKEERTDLSLKEKWASAKRQAELRHELLQAKKRKKNQDHKKRQRERRKSFKAASSKVLSGDCLSIVFPFMNPLENLWLAARLSRGVYQAVNRNCARLIQDPDTKKRAQWALEDQGPLQNWRSHKTPLALYLYENFRIAAMLHRASGIRLRGTPEYWGGSSWERSMSGLRCLEGMLAYGYGSEISLFDDDIPDGSEVAEFQQTLNELFEKREATAIRLLETMIAQGNPLACRDKFLVLCNSQLGFSKRFVKPQNHSPLYKKKGFTWPQAIDFFSQLAEAGDPEAAKLTLQRFWTVAIPFPSIRIVVQFMSNPCVWGTETDNPTWLPKKRPPQADWNEVRILNEWLIEMRDSHAIARKLRELGWATSLPNIYNGPNHYEFLSYALQVLDSPHLTEQHKDIIGEFMIQCALSKIRLVQIRAFPLFRRLMDHEQLKELEPAVIARALEFLSGRSYKEDKAQTSALMVKYKYFPRFYRLMSTRERF